VPFRRQFFFTTDPHPASGGFGQKRGTDGIWRTLNTTAHAQIALPYRYDFTSVLTPSTGVWVGPVHDTYANNAVPDTIAHTGTYPSGTTATTTVEAAHDAAMTSGLLTQSFTNLSSATAVTVPTNRRYWRIKVQLSTTSDVITPVVGAPTLKYSTTGVWVSEAIDHTTDITALNALLTNFTVPTGTTAVAEIATSSDNISYSPFTTIGAATPLRYSKVRITLTTNAGNTVTPTVNSARLNWTLVSRLISSAIDTGATPAGWDIFQAQFATNGGTVLFEMRSATTAGGLLSEPWTTVTNGQFPTVPVRKFVQWRTSLTSTSDAVPAVDSVTINWLVSTVQSIRVASIFFNRSYYLAAAEFNQTSNNVVLVLDGDGNWRVYRGLNINTLGYFFGEPYYGSSLEGRFVKFLQGTTDQGANIELILDTKSIEFNNPDHTKILRKVYLRGNNTGAVYEVMCSFDGGVTFYPLIDAVTGLTTFTTPANNLSFYRRFIPNFELGQKTAGKQIMFRVRENSAAPVTLEGLKAEVWVREGELQENADVN
jgi:hypothetical protein